MKYLMLITTRIHKTGNPIASAQGIQHRATFQSSDGENVLSAHNAGAHDATN
jgi:hypothetical protein